MPAVVAVLNTKGGSGKSTLATHLARGLQLQGGRSVLIVDSDPQGSARDWSRMQTDHAGMPGVVGIDRPVLEREIRKIAGGFDVVVIDGAARLQEMSVSALKASDLVLIPVQPSPLDVWAVSGLIELIQERQQITDGRPRAAFVISRQITGTNLANEARGVMEGFGLPVLEGRTAQRVAYAEALATGSTVLDEAPSGKAAGEIETITRNVLDLL